MQSYHDGEAMGTLHNGACEDDWAQPSEKSCGAERHQFLLRPTEVNLLLPPLPGTVCDPGASPRVSPNANILGFGGWHCVCAILESMRAASRATRPFCIRLHWHVYGTTIARGRPWCGLPVLVGMRRRTRRSPPRQLMSAPLNVHLRSFGGLPRVGLTQTRSCLTCCFSLRLHWTPNRHHRSWLVRCFHLRLNRQCTASFAS